MNSKEKLEIHTCLTLKEALEVAWWNMGFGEEEKEHVKWEHLQNNKKEALAEAQGN